MHQTELKRRDEERRLTDLDNLNDREEFCIILIGVNILLLLGAKAKHSHFTALLRLFDCRFFVVYHLVFCDFQARVSLTKHAKNVSRLSLDVFRCLSPTFTIFWISEPTTGYTSNGSKAVLGWA